MYYRAKAENARKALEPFVSRSESVALPKQILQYKPSLQYQYTATMQIVVRLSTDPLLKRHAGHDLAETFTSELSKAGGRVLSRMCLIVCC